MTSMRRSRSWVLVALLLTACSGDPDPVTTSSPEPVRSPSGSPSAGPGGLLLAVVRAGGALELHRVDETTRQASLERVLEPPAEGAEVVDVAASGAGGVCASWHTGPAEHVADDRESVLACYSGTSAAPRSVEGVAHPDQVALSASGDQVAWSEVDTGGNQALVTARLEGDAVSGTRRVLARADQPEQGERAFTGTVVQDLAWSDGDHLLVSTAVESDDGPRLLHLDVTSQEHRGWLDDGVPVPVAGEYFAYDSVTSADATWALAVQRGSWMVENAPPSRAVRVEVPSGRVLDVVATAAEGRDVVGVTGSPERTFYATAARGQDPAKVYLRLSGEDRGRPVTGLPADTFEIVAIG